MIRPISTTPRIARLLPALAAALPLAARAGADAPPAPPAAPAATTAAPAEPAATPTEPAADSNGGYTTGLIFGAQLRQAGFGSDLDLDALMRGLRAGLGGRDPDGADRARITEILRARRDVVVNRNRAAAAEFLARNAGVAGVQSTASGLQYQVLKPGDARAASPKLTDRVAVRYRGRLIDGTQFDSSDAHGPEAEFALSGVIPGWREALTLMKPGASWRLFVPPDLAYGSNSPGGIPPGSLLIFDVDLLRVTSSSAAPRK
jgi:FKBP-type peptidyl-prolyl cis-trans isomerase FkpA/FKBP-type peptidyl-prolyl cis-trans isomerase FklB